MAMLEPPELWQIVQNGVVGRRPGAVKDNADPCRNLVAAIILRAILDVRAGHTCDGRCRPDEGWHGCAGEAWAWLHSLEARRLYLDLDLEPDEVLEHLPGVAERIRTPGRPQTRCQGGEDASIHH